MRMTRLQVAIISVVNTIPVGQVVSYGQVALYVGLPRGARVVGWILRGLEGVDIPWWRVINNSGRISIKGNRYNSPADQRKLLRREGVEVSDLFEIDIEKYRFIPSIRLLSKLELPREYLSSINRWVDF